MMRPQRGQFYSKKGTCTWTCISIMINSYGDKIDPNFLRKSSSGDK